MTAILMDSITSRLAALEAGQAAATARLDVLEVGTTNVLVVSEVASSPAAQPARMSVTRGDSYLGADARAFLWTAADWPDLAGATVRFTGTSRQTGDMDIDVECSILGATVVKLQLASTDTAGLDLGVNSYDTVLEATLASGGTATLLRGVMSVTRGDD